MDAFSLLRGDQKVKSRKKSAPWVTKTHTVYAHLQIGKGGFGVSAIAGDRYFPLYGISRYRITHISELLSSFSAD